MAESKLSQRGGSDASESVEDGLDSMLFFYNYRKALESGGSANPDAIMEKILEYNKADCTATSRLYNWLSEGRFEQRLTKCTTLRYAAGDS